MSSFVCIVVGIIIGAIICYVAFHNSLKLKNEIIEDYKKGINIHNKRELRLIFINTSIKDYVKQQLEMIKKQTDTNNKEEASLAAARYIAFKDIEKTINHLEKNSEDFKV